MDRNKIEFRGMACASNAKFYFFHYGISSSSEGRNGTPQSFHFIYFFYLFICTFLISRTAESDGNFFEGFSSLAKSQEQRHVQVTKFVEELRQKRARENSASESIIERSYQLSPKEVRIFFP